MPKFMVRIKRENVAIRFAETTWLFWKKYSVRNAGLVTTRFVEAESANEAIESVIETVRTELEKDGRLTKDTILEFEEIQEDDEAFDLYAPGQGYTFYEQGYSES